MYQRVSSWERLSALSPVLRALASGAPVTVLVCAAATLSTTDASTCTVKVSWGRQASVKSSGAMLWMASMRAGVWASMT